MGSRILSRSFHVLRWKAGSEDVDEEAEVDEAEAGSALSEENNNAMNVDAPGTAVDEPTTKVAEEAMKEAADEDDDDDDDDDRYEDPADVAMVPMADMLNGRFNTETVRLRLGQCCSLANDALG
jgi:N-lysine methyltransferase SETD6